jgi:hypothetical protein
MHEKLCARIDRFLKLASDMTYDQALKRFGLDENFTLEQLKDAWRVAAFTWHPDRFISEEAKAEANTQFIEAKQALDVLLGKHKVLQFLRDLRKDRESYKTEKPSEALIPEPQRLPTTPADKPTVGLVRRPAPSPYSEKNDPIGKGLDVKAFKKLI